jgi:hypothetical protein
LNDRLRPDADEADGSTSSPPRSFGSSTVEVATAAEATGRPRSASHCLRGILEEEDRQLERAVADMKRPVRSLIVLLISGTMITAAAAPAFAWEHHRNMRVTQEAALWPHPVWYWLEQSVDWNTRTAAQCHSLYPCFGDIAWRRPTYGEGLYEFVSWGSVTKKSGIAANGVPWKSRRVEAQFKGCILQGGLNVCRHESAFVYIRIYADGTSKATGGPI